MSTKQCMACGGKGTDTKKLLRCSRCKDSYYCSIKCQKEFWPIHKQYCKKLVSDEYKVTPRSSRSEELSTHGSDVRIGGDGKVKCFFTPSETDDQTFMHLLIENAHVDVRGMKYDCDNTPTDDVPKMIVCSIFAMAASISSPDLVSGVMVVTEEDPKYYLMMRDGRRFIKNLPGIDRTSMATVQRNMSSVIKVKFVMANSNIKLTAFFPGMQYDNLKVLHAKDRKTISELKRHLEKNATATEQVICCPMRGSSRVHEGYLDMQNLD